MKIYNETNGTVLRSGILAPVFRGCQGRSLPRSPAVPFAWRAAPPRSPRTHPHPSPPAWSRVPAPGVHRSPETSSRPAASRPRNPRGIRGLSVFPRPVDDHQTKSPGGDMSTSVVESAVDAAELPCRVNDPALYSRSPPATWSSRRPCARAAPSGGSAWQEPSSGASRGESGAASCSSQGAVIPRKRPRGRPRRTRPSPRLAALTSNDRTTNRTEYDDDHIGPTWLARCTSPVTSRSWTSAAPPAPPPSGGSAGRRGCPTGPSGFPAGPSGRLAGASGRRPGPLTPLATSTT